MARFLSALLFTGVFLVVSSSAFAERPAKFTPLAGLPKTGYIFGLIDVPGTSGWGSAAAAFRKEGRVYAVLPDNLSERLPLLNITTLGFYKNYIIFGGQESKDLRKSWIIMLSFSEDGPKLVDVIKYTTLDKYDYDFYFSMPSIDAPKDIEDLDGDGFPEIEVDFYQRKFRMIVQVSDKGLNLDYSSPYYLRAFNKLQAVAERDEYQFREFLLFGIITGRLSERESVDRYLGRNSAEMGNLPVILADALNIKKAAALIGASEMLVSYFTGEIDASDITNHLDGKGRDSTEFMFALFALEKELNLLHLDEVAFNDFIAYFSDTMKEKEFIKSATKSLASSSGDIYSILTNYKNLNGALHQTTPLRLQRFDIK